MEQVFVNVGIQFQYNDGGRKEAGYKGDTRDCVCRAVAIATEQPYQKVYDDLNKFVEAEKKIEGKISSHSRTGIRKSTRHEYILSLGWKWVSCMGRGTGCKVHLHSNELPKGRLIVKVSKHCAAVIDGVLNDTHDCSRQGFRCVYGYYIKP